MTVDHLKVLDAPVVERAKPQATADKADTGFADELRATRAADEARAAQKREDARAKTPAEKTPAEDVSQDRSEPVQTADGQDTAAGQPVESAAADVPGSGVTTEQVATERDTTEGTCPPEAKAARTDVTAGETPPNTSAKTPKPAEHAALTEQVHPTQAHEAAKEGAAADKKSTTKDASSEDADSANLADVQSAPDQTQATPHPASPVAAASQAVPQAPDPSLVQNTQQPSGDAAVMAALAAPNPGAQTRDGAEGPGAKRQSDKRIAADAPPPVAGKGKGPAPKAAGANDAVPTPELAQGKTDTATTPSAPAPSAFAAQVASAGGETSVRSTPADAPQAQLSADQKSQSAAPLAQQKFDPGAGLRADTLSQLAVKIAKRFEGQTSTFHIRLDPPELGQVAVKLVMGTDKRVTAKLSTEKPEALEALSARSGELGQALRDLGFNLEDSAMSFDLNSGTNSAFADEREAQGFRGTRITFDAETTKDLVPDSDALGLVQGFAVTRTTRRELRA